MREHPIRDRFFCRLSGEETARLEEIGAELGGKGFEGGEAAFIAHAVNEFYFDAAAVEVAAEVEEIDLDGAAAIGAYGGSGAYVGHAAELAPVVEPHTADIYTRCGHELSRLCGDEISRGEAYGAPYLPPRTHSALYRIIAAEELCALLDAALGNMTADHRRAYLRSADLLLSAGDHIEAETPAGLTVESGIGDAVAAEAVVIAHEDGPDAEVVAQLAHKLFHGQRTELRGEVEHNDLIGHRAQHLLAAIGRHQQLRRAFGRHLLKGVAGKSYRHQAQPAATGLAARLSEQAQMTRMHTVKHARDGHASLWYVAVSHRG